jgi:ribosome maturation factor RimP
MQNILNEIKKLIEDPMKEMDISICSIDYVLENNYHFLKIVLDKVNGLDLDTIVEATNIINPILDEHDLIDEEYILDISSKERG